MMWLDVGIIFLLVIAIGFCYRLSDRLKALKGITTALSPSVERLGSVLNRANQAVGFLKEATESSQKGLTNYIPNAQQISNDLLLLIEHADRVSYRLDDLIVKASNLEKDLRQTVLVSMRELEKQKIPKALKKLRPHKTLIRGICLYKGLFQDTLKILSLCQLMQRVENDKIFPIFAGSIF